MSRALRIFLSNRNYRQFINPKLHYCTPSISASFDHQNEKYHRDVFDSTFPHVVRAVLHEEDPRLESVMQRFKQVLEYNVPFGKKHRGMINVMAYITLANPEEISKEQMYLVHLMGWCIELLQAFFLIEDDVMDQSTTRRGKECWFRNENVGMAAINDGIFLENAIFKILKMCYGNYPYYINILELFHEVILKTCYGQSLDALCSNRQNPLNLQQYTIENYETITEYKTSYYTFYLPVAVALHMHGIADPNIHAQAKDILLRIGHYFQVQDDILDCFGNSEETGKVGSDIREGKCTWLIVMALQKANEDQKKIIQNNYGHENPECIARVVNVYRDLKLPKLYKDYEEDTTRHITSLLQLPTFHLPPSVFTYCLSKIYKRTS